MSLVALKRGLEKYKGNLPKVVIVVHLYGLAANINKIRGICDEYGVSLIEDAAESLGAMYRGRYTGTFGDYSIIWKSTIIKCVKRKYNKLNLEIKIMDGLILIWLFTFKMINMLIHIIIIHL